MTARMLAALAALAVLAAPVAAQDGPESRRRRPPPAGGATSSGTAVWFSDFNATSSPESCVDAVEVTTGTADVELGAPDCNHATTVLEGTQSMEALGETNAATQGLDARGGGGRWTAASGAGSVVTMDMLFEWTLDAGTEVEIVWSHYFNNSILGAQLRYDTTDGSLDCRINSSGTNSSNVTVSEDTPYCVRFRYIRDDDDCDVRVRQITTSHVDDCWTTWDATSDLASGTTPADLNGHEFHAQDQVDLYIDHVGVCLTEPAAGKFCGE